MLINNWEDLAPLVTAIAGIVTAVVKVSAYLQQKQGKVSMREQSRLEQIAEQMEIMNEQCEQLLEEMAKLEKLLKKRERKESAGNE